jgi:hypothetical protein
MLDRCGMVLLESRRSTLPILSGPLSSLTNSLIPTHYHRTTSCTLPLNTCLANHVHAQNNKYRLENVIYETKKGFRPLDFSYHSYFTSHIRFKSSLIYFTISRETPMVQPHFYPNIACFTIILDSNEKNLCCFLRQFDIINQV